MFDMRRIRMFELLLGYIVYGIEWDLFTFHRSSSAQGRKTCRRINITLTVYVRCA
jgi:hypothetical protein